MEAYLNWCLQASSLQYSGMLFCVQNALKLAYRHMKVKKISGAHSRTPPKGERQGGERKVNGRIGQGREMEGKGREGKVGEEEEGRVYACSSPHSETLAKPLPTLNPKFPGSKTVS
jgi:hypothetical protein